MEEIKLLQQQLEEYKKEAKETKSGCEYIVLGGKINEIVLRLIRLGAITDEHYTNIVSF